MSAAPDWSEHGQDLWVECARCRIVVPRKSPQHKYCDDCRPAINVAYQAEWTRRNRRKVDRTETTLCECGMEYQMYTSPKGGPHTRCPDCTKKHRYANKQLWRQSPAGKASLDRQRRRAKGEYVEDQRKGPR